ncbi:MAG: pyrroline-5-carboxylate reductase [Candidatus Competibacter sp.]|nr:pyrroline-5-carboxylate reductase [Candidatus Competibacter sp.]MDG4585384.1 pyrroline-5-carboxylate reductase [Candidatus Competibacter sp.]
MKDIPIGFIGGGNMARSLIGGLLASGGDPDHIWVAEPDAGHRELLRGRFGVHTSADNREIATRSEAIILAVKPQVLCPVAEELADIVQERRPLVISIAAGVREPDIRRWLGGEAAIVRTMPNTPALVGSGATALFANPQVNEERRQLAESIMRSVGLTVWVKQERMLDAVTALSGSGPAYFFLLMEALEKIGVQLGLDPEVARLLTLQTAFGAAKMALESPENPAVLRARVTSPGGTTERAISVFKDEKLDHLIARSLAASLAILEAPELLTEELDGLVAKALEAARHRSEELGNLLGGQP